MISHRTYYIGILIAILAIAFAGCEKPGPISLTGPEQQPIIVPSSAKSLLTTDDIDPNGLLAPIDVQGYGQLLVEGSTYDSRTEHHTAAVARAVFFDATHPIYVNNETEFSTLYVGSMKIGSLPLSQVQKKYTNPGGTIDTLLGIQYLLFNEDSTGSSFTFDGTRTYTWQSSGTPTVPAFEVAITAPPALKVTYPSVRGLVRLSSSLSVKWTGGADTVHMYVRLMENGVPTKIIFQLRFDQNRGGALISKDLLSLLPHDQSQFMFTFTSSQTSRVKVKGFGDVAVQAVTTHNLVLQVRP